MPYNHSDKIGNIFGIKLLIQRSAMGIHRTMTDKQPPMLNTYGLEIKLMTPNFEAMKELLNVRFNMGIDDYNENNPLRDIL